MHRFSKTIEKHKLCYNEELYFLVKAVDCLPKINPNVFSNLATQILISKTKFYQIMLYFDWKYVLPFLPILIFHWLQV